MVEAVKPPRYVGQGAVTPESSLARSLNGLVQLEDIVDKHLTEAKKKPLAARMTSFKNQLTELGENFQDRAKVEAAIKESSALTREVGALLNKTAALSDVMDTSSSIKGMTQRIAVIGHDFRDASEGMTRGLQFIEKSISSASMVVSATKISQSAASDLASADALKHGNLQLSKGGVYRLTFDATNLQGEAHMAAGELLKAAKHQDIAARASYMMVDGKREMTIVFDGTAKVGEFLKVEPATALFVDTANLYFERAQKHTALGKADLAAKDLLEANKFNPAANYSSKDVLEHLRGMAVNKTEVATEMSTLEKKLANNLHQFVELTQEGRLGIVPKTTVSTPVATAITSEASGLRLTRLASGGIRYLGTAGVYFSLMDGMMEATAAITDKLHQQDLQEAQKLKATADYAREHQDLKNHDACKTAELCP